MLAAAPQNQGKRYCIFRSGLFWIMHPLSFSFFISYSAGTFHQRGINHFFTEEVEKHLNISNTFATPAYPNKLASNIRISYDGGQTLRRPRVQMLKLFGRVSSMKNGEELKKTPIIIFLSSCIKKRSTIVYYETHPIILAAIAISGHEYHKATREGEKKPKQLCCCCTM